MLKDYLKTFVLSILFMIGLLIVSVMVIKTPEIDRPNFIYHEEMLNKNAELAIRPGEWYVYEYNLSNSNISLAIEFQTKIGQNCVGIELKNTQNRTAVCLKKDGTDKLQSNLTLSEPAIFMFRPWMLALDDNWEWDIKTAVSASGTKIKEEFIKFRVTESDNVSGRTAYKVEMSDAEGSEAIVTTWVDKEKRVILKEMGPGYEINLVSADWLEK